MARRKNGTAEHHEEPEKRNFTMYAAAELVAEVRNLVATLKLQGYDVSISSFGEDALRAHVQRLRKSHNNGKPWGPPPKPIRLSPGRPLKHRPA